jgi:hypothetical protein
VSCQSGVAATIIRTLRGSQSATAVAQILVEDRQLQV